MAVLSISILITILYCLRLTVSGRFDRMRVEDEDEDEDFKALCSRKCNPSPEDSVSHPQYQCSCSESCAVYDDCCYDSSFKRTGKSLEHDFMCLSVVKRGEFRAVISCPPFKQSDTCRDSLGYLPPVTSRTTNITYGNIFCASCNGDVDNIITWNVQLRCDFEDEVTSVVYDDDGFWKLDEVEGTKTPCRFYEDEDEDEVLKGLELRPCSSELMVSSCSPSWTKLSVIEQCRSYEDPVYFHNTAYRNLHCAECNFLSPEFFDCFPSYARNMLELEYPDPRVFYYCQRRGCLQFLPEPGRGPGTILSLRFNIRDCTPAYGEQCCPDEKFQHKTGKCRKIRRVG